MRIGILNIKWFLLRSEKRFDAHDVESKKAVTNAKGEPGNAGEALRELKSWASTDMSEKCSAIKGRDCVQGDLGTTSARLQGANWAHYDTLDHL